MKRTHSKLLEKSCPRTSSISYLGVKPGLKERITSKDISPLQNGHHLEQRRLQYQAAAILSRRRVHQPKTRLTAAKKAMSQSTVDYRAGKVLGRISKKLLKQFEMEPTSEQSQKNTQALSSDTEQEYYVIAASSDRSDQDHPKSGYSGGQPVQAKPEECGSSQTLNSSGSTLETDGSMDTTGSLRSFLTTSTDHTSSSATYSNS